MTNHYRVPFRITLLAGLVLLVTCQSAVRLFTALAWRGTLERFISPPIVVYTAVSGAAWTVVGLLVLWAVVRRPRRGRLIVLASAGAYAAWAWLDRLFVQTEMRANWAFGLIVTIVLLAYVAVVVLDPRNQSYFEKRDL